MLFLETESEGFILLKPMIIYPGKKNLTSFVTCEVEIDYLKLNLINHIKTGVRYKHIRHLYPVRHLVIFENSCQDAW